MHPCWTTKPVLSLVFSSCTAHWVHIYEQPTQHSKVSLAQTLQAAYCSVWNKAHLASHSVTSNISEPILLLQVAVSLCSSQTQVCASAQHLFCKSEYPSKHVCTCSDLVLTTSCLLPSFQVNSVFLLVYFNFAQHGCRMLLTRITN